MKRNTLFGELMAEFFGTFILILLGDGVVANVGLGPRLAGTAYNWNTITIGWAFAVVVAVYVAGGVTGAHINPAVTIAMAVKRGFPWGKVVPYILAQLAGAFVGAAGVYLAYRDGLVAAGMPNVWSTGPGSVFGQAFWGGVNTDRVGAYGMLSAGFAEFFGTMVLLWGVLAAFDDANWGIQTKTNLGPFLVGFTVLAVGLSLGGPSGYSINPARDLGPRIFGALVGTQGLFDPQFYWLIIPVLVPAISGAIGIFLYDLFITPYLPRKEETPPEPQPVPEAR
ncbi:MAG: aquaporin family protein [Chloroflexi bacterium]|jgi:glycerol uptake facilitator protein|nr:aquaporin family protein [Chloroflexota bacterium]